MSNFYKAIAAAAVVGALLGAVLPTSHADQSSSSATYQTSTYDSQSEYYSNVSGNLVHRPVFSVQQPTGATAQCVDGSWSFSQHRRGTCSYHGGVARWLN